MKHPSLLSLYLVDLNSLTRRNRCRLAWYAGIILIPLAAVILINWWFGPGIEEVVYGISR